MAVTWLLRYSHRSTSTIGALLPGREWWWLRSPGSQYLHKMSIKGQNGLTLHMVRSLGSMKYLAVGGVIQQLVWLYAE